MKGANRVLRRHGFSGAVAVAAATVVSAFLWDIVGYGGPGATKLAELQRLDCKVAGRAA